MAAQFVVDPSREGLRESHRVIIKAGTSVVTHSSGYVALGRVGALVEQICLLQREGKQVIFVTSGSIGIGKHKLLQQIKLSSSMRSHFNTDGPLKVRDNAAEQRACAAAGQSGLMSLYETMFSHYGVTAAQILVTENDFKSEEAKTGLIDTINRLLALGIVPIINENDVVTAGSRPVRDHDNLIFKDNDSLASILGVELRVDMIMLLSDVPGLYNKPPSDTSPGTGLIHTYHVTKSDAKESQDVRVPSFQLGNKSRVGRGGMHAKLESAIGAVRSGVRYVIIASGYEPHTIENIMRGQMIGTVFTSETIKLPSNGGPGQLLRKDESRTQDELQEMAKATKAASLILQNMSSEKRSKIIERVAASLLKNANEILRENKKDVDIAESTNTSEILKARLILTESKLKTLASGLIAIAREEDPIGRVSKTTEVSADLILQRMSCPIGVVLVIFESRPDVLPQLAGLSLKTGNGLIMKGGKEAVHTNNFLHGLIAKAITEETGVNELAGAVSLVHSQQQVKDLLSLDKHIDLVIPRGSAQLVDFIQKNTKIAVLGHSEGVCHVYVDSAAPLELATRVVVDSKCDYPAACNATETLLLHREFATDRRGHELFVALRKKGVSILGGPVAVETFGLIQPTVSFNTEYGDLRMTVEIVDSVEQAISHINKYGSHHTDSIVSENPAAVEKFLQGVDSACVFHNASTRFADGYRFGLGAEVGISTGRIHARGPVGIEGLTTHRWVLKSSAQEGHTVGDFANGSKTYTHKTITSKL